jgi:hypothetical protein
MNALLRVKEGASLLDLMDFKTFLYVVLLSDVSPKWTDETKYGVSTYTITSLCETFEDFTHRNPNRCKVRLSLEELADEGLIFTDEESIYVGEYRGRKFFPFEGECSLLDKCLDALKTALDLFGRSKSAKVKSRSRFIKERIGELIDRGINNITASELTEVHGYLYEVYTGGEVYNLRNKVEAFQTNNMLKAYDRATTFCLLVEGTLNYDTYRKKGLPTITNVATMKDEVLRGLKSNGGSKEYMREEEYEQGDF